MKIHHQAEVESCDGQVVEVDHVDESVVHAAEMGQAYFAFELQVLQDYAFYQEYFLNEKTNIEIKSSELFTEYFTHPNFSSEEVVVEEHACDH